MSSYANLQTVEELLPFADSVEKKALPEVIGFLNHCLTAAPQWTAKDTDLMAIAARGAIDTAKKCCPRIETWVAILAQHDDWISDPKAPLDLSVFSNPEPLPDTDTRDGGQHVEWKKREGKAKGRDSLHGGEPMNLDVPEPEDFGGKKRRTPIVSDNEMEPLEREVPTKRQKTDLETFRRVGGVAGHELGRGGDVPGEPKLVKGKARAQAKKQQPQKLEMMKVYDPPCQTCARRKVECSTWYENQACTECSKSKLKCRYAKGGAGDGEEDELELEAEESKPKPKTKLPARKSDNQSAKGQGGVSKAPAKRAPKAKRQSTGGNVGSDSYCESECDDEMEKRPKAAKEQGKGQVKKQASSDANRKAPGKSNGPGQLSTLKGSGKATKKSGSRDQHQGGQRVGPGTRHELIAGNIEDAVATYIERAVSHEMTTAELRGELSGVRRELEGVASEVSELYERDEHNQDAIEKLQEDFEGLDGRFQNLDIRPFVNETQRSIQLQIATMSKKQTQEMKRVEESVTNLLKRVELLEQGGTVPLGVSSLTQDQVENIIDLKLAGMTKNGGQGSGDAAGDGMVVDSKVLEAVVHRKISWFSPERMEEVVNKRVDEIVGKGSEELMERLSSLEGQMAEDKSSKELSERLGVFETQLGSMANREETSGEGSALASSLKALEELIRVQTEGVRLQIEQLKSEMGQTLVAHGQEVRTEVHTHLHSVHEMMLQQTQAQAELYKNFSSVLEAVRRFKEIIRSSPQQDKVASRHSRRISLDYEERTDESGGMAPGGETTSRIVEAMDVVEAVGGLLRPDMTVPWNREGGRSAPDPSGNTLGGPAAPLSVPANGLMTHALGESMNASTNSKFTLAPVSLGHLMPHRRLQEGSSVSSAAVRSATDPGRMFTLERPFSVAEGSVLGASAIPAVLESASRSTPSFPSPGANASGATRPSLSNVSTPREHRSRPGSPLTGLTSEASGQSCSRTDPPPQALPAEEEEAEVDVVPRRTRATARREGRGR